MQICFIGKLNKIICNKNGIWIIYLNALFEEK